MSKAALQGMIAGSMVLSGCTGQFCGLLRIPSQRDGVFGSLEGLAIAVVALCYAVTEQHRVSKTAGESA